MAVQFIPDSATGYTVQREDGLVIGRVEKVFQDWRSRRSPTWRYQAPNGAFGEVDSRSRAVDSLQNFAK